MNKWIAVIVFLTTMSCARHHGKNRFDYNEFIPFRSSSLENFKEAEKIQGEIKEESVISKEEKGWLW